MNSNCQDEYSKLKKNPQLRSQLMADGWIEDENYDEFPSNWGILIIPISDIININRCCRF